MRHSAKLVTREAVIEEARRCVARGIRFRHQGRSEDTGLDCIGTPLRFLTKAGWKPLFPQCLEVDDYDRLPSNGLLESYLRLETREVPQGEEVAGDFVLMACHSDGSREANHLALLTDAPLGQEGPFIIHAHVDHGVVEHCYSQEWQKLTVGYYRLMDFIDEENH